MKEAFEELATPAWPYESEVEQAEHDPASGRSEAFRVRDWCLLDKDSDPRPFDHETFRILRPYIEGRKRNSRVILTSYVGATPA